MQLYQPSPQTHRRYISRLMNKRFLPHRNQFCLSRLTVRLFQQTKKLSTMTICLLKIKENSQQWKHMNRGVEAIASYPITYYVHYSRNR